MTSEGIVVTTTFGISTTFGDEGRATDLLAVDETLSVLFTLPIGGGFDADATQPVAVASADAVEQVSGVMRISSSTSLAGEGGQDIFELSVEAGDRLNVSLFSGREVPVGPCVIG